MLADKPPTIHKAAQLLGKFTSTFPAVQYAQLYYMPLERDKIMSLKNAKRNFSKKMSMSPLEKSDLLWWVQNIENDFLSIQRGNCGVIL